MERRTFLYKSVAAGATVAGFPGLTRASERVNLVDEVGHSVIAFLDDDWSRAELEDAMSDAVDVVCYAYGKLEAVGDEEPDREPGYLQRIRSLGWEELKNNPEAYDWILDYAGRIADFVGSLDVFSDRIGEKLDAVTEAADEARTVTKFIPLVWSIRGILDVGCRIHRRLEAGDGVQMATYIEFFRQVALAIVNIVLLAAGIGFAYSAAFRATGSVNSILVNTVGRRIGWNAYSWLLSLVHWGIRVIFAEGMGEAINDATEAVVGELVEASPLPRERAVTMARSDVREVAEHADDRGLIPDYDYEIWNSGRKLENRRQEALERANQILDGIPKI